MQHEEITWPIDHEQHPYRALGCYIYAGGFSVGVAQHFQVLAHLEDGNFGTATVKHNFGERFPIFKNPDHWPAEDYRGRVDLIYGNPPCAPWSRAGVKPKRNQKHSYVEQYKHDPRVACVYNLYGLLEEVRPRVWVWESVQAAWKNGRPMVEDLTAGAHDLGYSATYLLFNGADLGTPQRRRRFFCVFHDVELDWDYPAEPRHITVSEALEGLPDPQPEEVLPLRSGRRKVFELTDQGENARHAFNRMMTEKLGPDQDDWPKNERGHVKGRPGWSVKRLTTDGLANTHMGGCHLLHPTEHRWITVAEAKRLGGYPDDYEIITQTLEKKYVVMFRAVLPHAAVWLARNVRRGLERREPVQEPTAVLRDFEQGTVQEIDVREEISNREEEAA